ncbi:hypothetical protein NDU88_004239 [Pleurodeles waltl]|uniref:Uncharacterized protein n=1 Tax=Pleurodeles waltl TaxID=8319 RepID=A0AAV7MTZ8_PLEWA|nr:hypothetical protein NDU88_004239 [Pleurodeles waltl]
MEDGHEGGPIIERAPLVMRVRHGLGQRRMSEGLCCSAWPRECTQGRFADRRSGCVVGVAAHGMRYTSIDAAEPLLLLAGCHHNWTYLFPVPRSGLLHCGAPRRRTLSPEVPHPGNCTSWGRYGGYGALSAMGWKASRPPELSSWRVMTLKCARVETRVLRALRDRGLALTGYDTWEALVAKLEVKNDEFPP